MTSHSDEKGRENRSLRALGVALPLLAWVSIKYGFQISDRWLPSPLAVVQAFTDVEPNVLIHLLVTALRLVFGFAIGLAGGLGLGLLLGRSSSAFAVLGPCIQSFRAVPAAAVVPFFLLWFGFSETGRLLLVTLTVALNVAVASHQILRMLPERYVVMFRSFHLNAGTLTWHFALPHIAERLLPTLRFSLAVVIGAQTVSELLGAQIGLGYLIQSARATFSLHVLFLAMIVLGLLNTLADAVLCTVWRRLIFWRPPLNHE